MPNISLWTRVMVEQSQTQTLAALKAITASAYGVNNGVFAFVPGLGLFQYAEASGATADDINVIQPTSGTGRWLRLTQAAPTVSSNGKLLLQNIDFSLYQATVNGDGSANYLTVYDALTAGETRMIVTGNTVETTTFVFDNTQHDINITILPDVKIDCGALTTGYDASTNASLVNFVVNGISNSLRSGFIWSPTSNGASLFRFNNAQAGSRVTINNAYIASSAATATVYHAFNAGANIGLFGENAAFAISDAAPSFILGFNIVLNLPLFLGSGTNSAEIIGSPNADVCRIFTPIFINQFSSTLPAINAKNLYLQSGLNVSSANIAITGNNATVSDLFERFSPLSFNLTFEGASSASNCYLPNGTILLSSQSTYTSLNSSAFLDLDESGNPTTGEVNICNVSFLQSQDFGTSEKVTWNLTNVNVFADAQISGRDVTWNGGAVGSSTTPHNLTINAGATNALVNNVRTNAAITNNEPSAMLGLNPFFS